MIGKGFAPWALVGCLLLVLLAVIALFRMQPLIAVTVIAFLAASTHLTADVRYLGTIRWVLLGTTLFVALIRTLMARGRGGVVSAVPVPMVALVSLAFVSTAWSLAPSLTLGRAAAFGSLIVVVALLRQVEVSPEQLLKSLRFMAIGAAAVHLIAYVGGVRTASGAYAGIFANPNTLGVANALLFPVVFGACLHGKGASRAIHASAAGALTLEVLLSGSRGGTLALLASYLYLIIPKRGSSFQFFRLLAVVVPVAVALIALNSVVDPEGFRRANTRGKFVEPFKELFAESPIVGHGFGTSERTLIPYFAFTGYTAGEGVNFHNSYFNLLNDLGVLGGITMLMLLARAFSRRRQRRREFAAVAIAGLVSGASESWMFAVGSGFPLIFWMSILELTRGAGEGSGATVVSGHD